MKNKIILGLILVFNLTSCEKIINTTVEKKDNLFIVNTAWKIVRSESMSRDITSNDALIREINLYNETHTDDQWRLYEGEVPPITEAPRADAFFCDRDTHKVIRQFLNIERKDISDRRDAWRNEIPLVQGENSGKPVVLFVDRVPEVVPVPEPPIVNPYSDYALYIIDTAGVIIYERHLTTLADYNAHKTIFEIEVQVNGLVGDGRPWQLIAGRLYP